MENPMLDKIPAERCGKRLAKLSKGLAHPIRVKIIRLLADKPADSRCVCGDIVDALPLAQSTVSQHLKVLRETGWIKGEIDGPYVCYCIVEGILEYYLTLMEHCLLSNTKMHKIEDQAGQIEP